MSIIVHRLNTVYGYDCTRPHMDLSKACTALHGIRTAVWFVADEINAAIHCCGRRNLIPALYVVQSILTRAMRLSKTLILVPVVMSSLLDKYTLPRALL